MLMDDKSKIINMVIFFISSILVIFLSLQKYTVNTKQYIFFLLQSLKCKKRRGEHIYIEYLMKLLILNNSQVRLLQYMSIINL